MQNASWEKGGDFGIGTITTDSSRSNGVGYVLLFNSHTATNMPDINRKIIEPMVRTRTDWPTGDLFKDYQQPIRVRQPSSWPGGLFHQYSSGCPVQASFAWAEICPGCQCGALADIL